MNLSEFIKKRLEELGKNRSWLVNFGDIEWSTLSNIDKGRGISKETQEKLASALGCTQGDIQACLAEQNPLKNVVVNKKSLAKTNAKKTVPAPDPKDEEPAEVFQTEPEELPFTEEPEVDMMFPEPEATAEPEETAKQYRHKLHNMVFKVMVSSMLLECAKEDIFTDIGIALVKELASYED